MGIGKCLLLWKHQDHSRCPRCDQPQEDAQHVILYPSSTATGQWKISMNTIQEALCDNGTSPAIQRAIVSGLSTIRGRQLTPPQIQDPTYDAYR